MYPAVEATGLAKTYHDAGAPIEVLRGLNLRVDPGEVVAVVGASGSGKSTLLHLLGGLDRPTAGTVRVGGEDLSTLDEAGRSRLRARSVGFVFQFHQLLPEFTALENVMMPGWVAGASRTATRERALSLLGDLGLSDRAEHKPGELSGGEQQRVAVARALHMRPAVLLADEPTGNLDRKASATLLEIFERYRSRERQAIVIATHNPDVAESAGRVVSLEDGYLKPIRIESGRI
ncbi:MAG TPA: ABC transporter ATP-binding protein [Candidatus Limnocylindrales bacterium]|nr:ABC transporter ATP-binding protein [Candidatus Limnocylindrales bacterium]